MAAALKKCYVCQQYKPLLEFFKNKSKKDGLDNACKKCKSCKNAETYRKYHKRRLQEAKVYRETHKQQRSNCMKRHILDYPKKYKTHYQFQNAIRCGKIKRATNCQICGIECITNGHHENYDKPFEVVFVCDSCHGKLRRKVV